MNSIIDTINKEHQKDEVPVFRIGDTVKVHNNIREGSKERIQIFAGTVIARDGTGATETFTVRHISYGEGVEKIFPIHSPNVVKVEIQRPGRTRRAKLYYIRKLTGKKARIDERRT